MSCSSLLEVQCYRGIWSCNSWTVLFVGISLNIVVYHVRLQNVLDMTFGFCFAKIWRWYDSLWKEKIATFFLAQDLSKFNAACIQSPPELYLTECFCFNLKVSRLPDNSNVNMDINTFYM